MSATAERKGQSQARLRDIRLDWFEWCCFGLLLGLSLSLLVYALARGGTWTGGEGPAAMDQLQYLTWIREASNHFLIGNRWDFSPDSRVFLHPGFLISGLVHRFTGLSLQWSYTVLWKPVALLSVFGVTLLWVRRLVVGLWPRRLALFIALFVVMPWSALLKFFGVGNRVQAYVWGLHLDFPSGEIWTIQPLQGYSMTAIAIALMAAILLGVANSEKDLTWRRTGLLSLGSLLLMWLQPWQGAELLLIVAAVEVWLRVRAGTGIRWRLLALLVAGSVPAIYYAWLGQTDSAWKLAGEANSASHQALIAWPLWAIVATFVPLLLPAVFAYRRRTDDWGQLAARMWPIAAGVIYLLPLGTFPFHAVQGVMIPLSVLIVQGLTVSRPKWLSPLPKWAIVALLLFFSVPGTIHKMWSSVHLMTTASYPYNFEPGEQAALRWLETNRTPGGVLTNGYGGLLVPPFSGRESYIGPFSWTPDLLNKTVLVDEVFSGTSNPETAQSFVRGTGARFIFQPCHGKATAGPSLRQELGDLVESEHQFGCSRVYVLRPSVVSELVSAGIGGPDGG
jgi:hypothetical protein